MPETTVRLLEEFSNAWGAPVPSEVNQATEPRAVRIANAFATAPLPEVKLKSNVVEQGGGDFVPRPVAGLRPAPNSGEQDSFGSFNESPNLSQIDDIAPDFEPDVASDSFTNEVSGTDPRYDLPNEGTFSTERQSTPQTSLAATSLGSDWWQAAVLRPLAPDLTHETVTLDSLLYQALLNSHRIRFLSKDPLMREQEVVESSAEFDPVTFARTLYEDRVDPVGNTLTAIGEEFLRDNIWTAAAGVRRKLGTGGQLEVSQKLGFQNSNSNFFVPQDQGTATLGLNFNQPLLRGGGRMYNRSQILLARTNADLAWETFSTELQNELQLVVDAYWELYFRRALFLQTQRHVRRGESVLARFEGRAELDSLPSHVARARSEVHSRRTELTNALRDLRNAETEIRRLVSQEDWVATQSVELLPGEAPQTVSPVNSLEQEVRTALENRTEIRAAVRQSRLAAIRTDMLTNELLPNLSLLFSTYASALEGDSAVEGAFQQQFSSDPGVALGLEFELPRRNRAARSRHTRSKLQMAKVFHEIRQTTLNVIAETQIAHRRLVSAIETLESAKVAVEAAQLDLEQHHRRWENFALIEGDIIDGQSPTIVLDQLLDSQDRLVDAELVYARAIRELKFAENGLRRANGTLLTVSQVEIDRDAQPDQRAIRFGQ